MTLVLTVMYPTELPPGSIDRFRAAADGVEVNVVPYREPRGLRNARRNRTVTSAELAEAPALTGDEWALLERSTGLVTVDLPPGLVERAPSLRWVQTLSAGVDHLDLDVLRRRGIVVTNGSGFQSSAIAEFVMARVLQVWKRLRELDAVQQAERWEKVYGRGLAGTTLGIVGLGSIGRALATRARAFGMRVVANRRSAPPDGADPDADRVVGPDGLDAMLEECDVVVLCAALTDETRRLFDADRIARMKPGSVLCNVARGGLVDEAALVAALASGHLSAAVVDVTQREPLPPGDPLWKAPNCYLSPHTSVVGGASVVALVDRVERNLRALAAGEPLEGVAR